MENIEIIYEDDDILAVSKPAGLLVHGSQNSDSQSLTLVDWLIKNYPQVKNVGDDFVLRPGIVHRLDKDTSGVLLVAKNQEAFEYLKSQFQNRKIKKRYIALVEGSMKTPAGGGKGIIDLPIGKSQKDFRKKVAGAKISGKTREAVTEYRILKKFSDYTLVEAFPLTGRTHQIRVHFKAIGHSIVCDGLYGSVNKVCPFGLARHFLHASSLELSLPSGARIKLEAVLPSDLQNVLNMLNYNI